MTRETYMETNHLLRSQEKRQIKNDTFIPFLGKILIEYLSDLARRTKVEKKIYIYYP